MILLAAATGSTEAAEAANGSAAALIGVAAVLVLVAVALFFLEALFPSFGVITIAGLVCVAGALVAAFQVSRLVGFVFVAIAVLAIPATALIAVRLLRKTGVILEDVTGPKEAGGAARDGGAALKPGAVGVAITALRPSGTAVFDDRRESVVTAGQMVGANEQVEVVEVQGARTVVRPVRKG
jgi:membrane-bound serine protease (ClpP class)